MKKRLKVDLTLYTILQILSITLFEKMPILQALTANDYRKQMNPTSHGGRWAVSVRAFHFMAAVIMSSHLKPLQSGWIKF